jgi:hypothetical protein
MHFKEQLPTVYIGYDPAEDTYFRTLAYSIKKHASEPINIVPLVQTELRRAGLYYRSPKIKEGRLVDIFDGKPFSTEFSFSRFLVPFLQQFSGKAIFMDSDMYVRGDIMEVFDKCKPDSDKAIWCVKHDYTQEENSIKKDDKLQQNYFRKNWSSFVLWNCENDIIKREFTVSDVNNKSGSWLHSFYWLDNDQIGSLDEEWNWLDNYSPESISAKNVHFTLGGPMFPNWTPSRKADAYYAEELIELQKEMLRNNSND